MKDGEADGKRWLRQAVYDVETVRILLSAGRYSAVCFMSHQAAEKSLKALAYYRGDRFVIGHSLLDLFTQLRETYPQLEVHLKTLKRLERYYISTRYPDALPGGTPYEAYDDQEEAEEAFRGAVAVADMAREVIPR